MRFSTELYESSFSASETLVFAAHHSALVSRRPPTVIPSLTWVMSKLAGSRWMCSCICFHRASPMVAHRHQETMAFSHDGLCLGYEQFLNGSFEMFSADSTLNMQAQCTKCICRSGPSLPYLWCNRQQV